MNPIQKEEIIDFQGTSDALQALIDKLKEMKSAAGDSIKEVTVQAKALAASLKDLGGKSPIPPELPDNTKKLSEEFKELLRVNGILETDITKLTNVQRDQNAIWQASQKYVAAAGSAYNNMSAEYTALKAVMNTLNPEIEEQGELLQKLTKRTHDLYEEMNKYQQKTGRYQLQVGQYSKAFSGLSLSMNQVVREVPTLANSFNQFTVAISNNLPILVDNIIRYNDAHKEAVIQQQKFVAEGLTAAAAAEKMGDQAKYLGSTIKAVGRSLLSWNVILIAAITSLEFITKAIDKKRRAAKQAKEEMSKLADATKLWKDGVDAVATSVLDSTSKLKTLYEISTSVRYSIEEQDRALAKLKELYPEAGDNIEEYIKKLEKQAKAEAVIREIAKLRVEQMRSELNYRTESLNLEQELLQATVERDAAKKLVKGPGGATAVNLALLAAAEIKLKSVKKEIKNLAVDFDKAGKNSEKTIKQWEDILSGLVDSISGGKSGGAANSLAQIKDYTFKLWQARIDGMEEGIFKERQQIRLDEAREKADLVSAREELYKELNKLDKNKNKERAAEISKQLKTLEDLEVQQAKNIEKRLRDLHKKYFGPILLGDIDLTGSGGGSRSDLDKKYAEKIISIDKRISLARKYNEQAVLDKDRDAQRESYEAYKQACKDKLDIEAWYQTELAKLKFGPNSAQAKAAAAEAQVKAETAKGNLDKTSSPKRGDVKNWLLAQIFGETVKDKSGLATGEKRLTSDQSAFLSSVISGFQTAINYAQEYLSVLSEIAQKEVDAAHAKVEATKEAYDYEREARANGYANSVEVARKEYQEKLKIEKEALKKKEEITKQQERLDTLIQISSLISATAQLWSAHASIPIAGPILAAAATAAMWGSFLATKIKAQQLQTYGEGMSEYIGYGDSHASGHDVDFGTDNRGRKRRVERGEVVGVVNKKNVRKFGVKNVKGVIDSLNDGTFGEKYGNAFQDVISVNHNEASVDLSRIEKGVSDLVDSGSKRVVISDGCIIEYYKNKKRIIRN